jgi:hypothetical protein
MWTVVKKNPEGIIIVWLLILIGLGLRTLSVIYGWCDDFFIPKIEIGALIPLLLFNLFYLKKLKPETRFWVFYGIALLHIYVRVIAVEMNIPASGDSLHYLVGLFLIYTQVFIIGELYICISRAICELLTGKSTLDPWIERLLFFSKVLLFYSYIGWALYSMALQDLVFCDFLHQRFNWDAMLYLAFLPFIPNEELYCIWDPLKELWEFLGPNSVSCAGDETDSTHFPLTPAEQNKSIHEGKVPLNYKISGSEENRLPTKAVSAVCVDPCGMAKTAFKNLGLESKAAMIWNDCHVECVIVNADKSSTPFTLLSGSLGEQHVQVTLCKSELEKLLKQSDTENTSGIKGVVQQTLVNRIVDTEIPKVLGQEEGAQINFKFGEPKEKCIIS